MRCYDMDFSEASACRFRTSHPSQILRLPLPLVVAPYTHSHRFSTHMSNKTPLLLRVDPRATIPALAPNDHMPLLAAAEHVVGMGVQCNHPQDMPINSEASGLRERRSDGAPRTLSSALAHLTTLSPRLFPGPSLDVQRRASTQAHNAHNTHDVCSPHHKACPGLPPESHCTSFCVANLART